MAFPHNHPSWFCFFLLILVSFPQLAYSVSLVNRAAIHHNISSTSPCRPDQSLALLQFKSSSSIEYDVSKLWSWKANTDCCTSWEGVSCDHFGYVIGLDASESGLVGNIDSNNSLFNLYHLQNVNLANNDFRFSSIPAGFARLNRSLTHLDLSSSNFSGVVPQEISQLTNLISLDLSYLDLEVLKSPNTSLRTLISNFSSLMELHLDSFMSDGYTSTISAHEWLSVIASVELHHLQVLTLSDCKLAGSIGTSLLNLSSLSHLDLSDNDITHFPQQMFHLPNLKVLDMSYNSHLTGSLPEFPPGTALQQLFLADTNYIGRIPQSIGNLKRLTYFQVGNCGFFGPLPHSFGNLRKLAFLDLARNNFEGEIPFSFSKLSHLEELDMSSNRFVGPLPSLKASRKTIKLIQLSYNKFSGPIPSSYANNGLPNLTYLYLSNNQLNGTIPPSLLTLPSLQEMYLDQNEFIGILDDEAFPNSISSPLLARLDLSYNLLEGNIPKFISKLTSLEYLDLSSNNFHGAVDPRMFTSLKDLSVIHLSDNIMLLIDTSDLVITIPSLSEFAASSCNLSAVPEFLRYQPVLQILDLSNNQIQGKMPDWLWTNLENVYLSNNSLVGFEDPFSNHSSSSLEFLDLSSNNFEGSLPNFPKGMDTISLSKNKFTGAIPLTICNSSWSRIDLSHNQISGEIPSCLFNSFIMDRYPMSVVDLSKNKLQGMIPDTFGSKCSLEGLNLNGNQLEGPLPRSLVNCRGLRVLDLGNNQIDDTFPFWLEHLGSLLVLMLQSNKFHGPIRRRHIANSTFESLHIISLSANSFTGHLPLEYFSSSYLKGMYEIDHHQTSHTAMPYVFYTFLMFPNKGQALEYSGVQIPVLNAIDLSSNLFDGEIPTSIGDYKSVMSLNLSHNSLVGKIPSSLANLTQLESLDLSNNDLMGEIPSELTSLTSLSVLDVSRNDLIGTIPTGGQFLTFPSSSFEGNSRLCGIQLQIDCNPNKSGNVAPPSDHANQSNGANFDWIFAVAGYGSGLVVGVVIEHFVLWRNRYYLEKFMNTIRFFQGKRPLRVRSLRRRRN